MKYEVIIYWSEDDRAFIAEVPELPGYTADGETYQEALQNLEIMMQEWIDTARQLEGKGYQSLMNSVLRSDVEHQVKNSQ
jgi:predicted RNase H-like HicB family nuclease